MALPSLIKQVELPAGGSAAGIAGRLRLVAGPDGSSYGYAAGVNVDVAGVHVVSADPTGLLTWSTVRPNSGVSADVITSPVGTVYEVTTVLGDRAATVEYVDVPDTAGPLHVQDILTSAPE